MPVKLYLFLPQAEASALVRDGFPDSNRRYRLNSAEYTACSAFNPQSLIEIVLELDRAELERYRREMEQPIDEEASYDGEFGSPEAESIYWYELPASVLCKTCRSRRIVNSRRE